MCFDGSKLFPGHGPIGVPSSLIHRGIKALENVLKEKLLEFNEDECINAWLQRGNVPFRVNSDMTWVEWDHFLNVSVVQWDKFVFARLEVEHEH